MNNDLFNKLLILRTPGVGAVKYAGLIEQFGSAAVASESLSTDIVFADGVRREMDLAASLGIQYISDDDVRYPANLLAIKNHPPVIAVRGNVGVLQLPAVAIVGTRHATGAGMRFVSMLSEKFAAQGHAVVSGMAMGTDTAAHTGAIRAQGATIAVLAGGADYIWPMENESLYYKIMECGCIVSEMPVGSKPIANNFIQRNRWIAGLADKLILGEADAKSGSMATAGFALDYGCPVFAVPGHPSDARSAGPNSLIKSGMAKIICGTEDFFANDEKIKENIKNKKEQIIENNLLDKLGTVPQSESVLAELVKKTVSEIKSELVIMELQGMVRKTNNGYVKN